MAFASAEGNSFKKKNKKRKRSKDEKIIDNKSDLQDSKMFCGSKLLKRPVGTIVFHVYISTDWPSAMSNFQFKLTVSSQKMKKMQHIHHPDSA